MTNLLDIFQGHHEHPALFQERSVLEGLHPQLLRDFIEDIHHKQTDLARLEALATDLLSGYGEEA